MTGFAAAGDCGAADVLDLDDEWSEHGPEFALGDGEEPYPALVVRHHFNWVTVT